MTLRFAVIGVAGYIAPRHLDAIRDVGGDVVAAFDVMDSVGRLDASFPKARFFTDFERFQSFVMGLRAGKTPVDYVSICSPNHLHRAHIEFALRAGAHVICEKPLVLDPSDVDALERLERETGKKVFTILQLRLNPANIQLKADLTTAAAGRHDCVLTYVTSRGNWYHVSWKGDDRRSGGISTNIGVHFYDLLSFMFGKPSRNAVHHKAMDCAAGCLDFERARVRWFLSINARDLPANAEDRVSARQIAIGDRICNLSGDFRELHTKSYKEIVDGRGFGLDAARSAIEIVSAIRTSPVARDPANEHPAVAKVIADGERYADGFPV